MTHRWSSKEDWRIVEMAVDGVCKAEIARIVGVSPSALYTHIRRAGLPILRRYGKRRVGSEGVPYKPPPHVPRTPHVNDPVAVGGVRGYVSEVGRGTVTVTVPGKGSFNVGMNAFSKRR